MAALPQHASWPHANPLITKYSPSPQKNHLNLKKFRYLTNTRNNLALFASYRVKESQKKGNLSPKPGKIMAEERKYPILNEYFEALKEKAPQRDAEEAAKGRTHFMAEVKGLQKPQPTSWLADFRKTLASLQIRGNRRLATAVASVLIALIITLGSVGGTVYASQDSLPTQALYAVKTLTEDIQLRFADQTQEKIDLLEKFTNRRVDEVTTLAERGEDIPQDTISRFERHTETMLKLSAELEGENQAQTLSHIRNALQVHEEVIQKLAERESGKAGEALRMVQGRLRSQIKRIEEGMLDPTTLQENNQDQNPFKPFETPPSGKPENIGPPEEKGKPDGVGTPDHKGKPDDAGPPDDKGKPEDPGPPEDNGKP